MERRGAGNPGTFQIVSRGAAGPALWNRHPVRARRVRNPCDGEALRAKLRGPVEPRDAIGFSHA